MIVTQFNRGPRPGNFTFEQLFGCLKKEICKSIKIVSRDLPTNMSPWAAIHWAKRHTGEINHITGDVNYLAYGLPKNRTIITVHDLGHFSNTLQGIKKQLYKKFWLTGPLFKVEKITAISEFTKGELINLLGISQNKIEVIPNPLLPGFEFQPKEFSKDKVNILQIGSGKNKNLGRLIEASTGLPVRLTLVNKLFDPELKKQLEKSNTEYLQCADLTFSKLLKAYRDCDILFFASEYEGFGMPIIEAQATGRVVITSNISSMPEVAGEGAILVDPFSSISIRKAIESLIEDKTLREGLIDKGLSNVKKYSLEVIAQQYIKLYQSLKSE